MTDIKSMTLHLPYAPQGITSRSEPHDRHQIHDVTSAVCAAGDNVKERTA